MRHSHDPVTMGSPRSRSWDTGTFRLTEAWFPPESVLDAHTHDRSIVAVMLEGSFATKIAQKDLDCSPTTVWTEPREERHANYVGRLGARVLVAQPDPDRDDLHQAFAPLLNEVTCTVDPSIALDARRVAEELANVDSLSPLVLDSLVTLMFTRAARLSANRQFHARAPRWLERARELLHEHYRERIELSDLASTAGVTPWHLAREFRRYFNASIGEYARSLRLAWALEQLSSTVSPISNIAHAAGYSDQSHLTRVCRATTGLAPAAYRRRAQG